MDHALTDALRDIARARDIAYDDIVALTEEAIAESYARRDDAPDGAWATIDEDGVRLWAHDETGTVIECEVPERGRFVAAALRRVMESKLGELEAERQAETLEGERGRLVIGSVQAVSARAAIVDLGRAEALLPFGERLPGERLRVGQRVRAVVRDVQLGAGGLVVQLSRAHPSFVSALFIDEVPEIDAGYVEIVKVVRDPGVRAKVAVRALREVRDPVGVLVGPRGARIRAVMRELAGERVDVVSADESPERQLARALAPARITRVVAGEAGMWTVIVPDDELGKALGRHGANARLAAALTGLRFELVGARADAARSEQGADGERGRCAARLASGRRCPNAAVAGTRFCGLPAHAEAATRERSSA